MENVQQQENWNGPGVQPWVRFQERIDRAVQYFHGLGLEALDAQPGERIIDIGCGSGTTTMDLARAVGAQGQVLGLDFSEPLLGLARQRCADFGQIGFQQGDAGQPRSERNFDALFSRYGVMFFKRPAVAFGNLRQALRPGGRLAFVCWQGMAQNAWIQEPMERLIPFLPEAPPAPKPNSPGAFGLADTDFTREQLTEAGFSHIRIEPREGHMILGTQGVPSAVEFNMQMGPAMSLAKDLPQETHDRIEAAFADLFEKYCQDSVVSMPASAWIITARV